MFQTGLHNKTYLILNPHASFNFPEVAEEDKKNLLSQNIRLN